MIGSFQGDANGALGGILLEPSERGLLYSPHGAFYALQRLPADSPYNVNLVLQNVVAGSRYRVTKVSDGSLIIEGDATAGTNTLSIPYYIGDYDVIIKIRKASASPFYKPFQTQATIFTTGATAYILQEADE